MSYYTRLQLCQLLHVSNTTLRRILDVLDIQPTDIIANARNCPVYLYDQQVLDILCTYIKQAQDCRALRRARGVRCRGGCGQYYKPLLLSGSHICKTCRNNKSLLNLAYNKKPWLKLLDTPAVLHAISFLQNLLKKSKKV